MTGFLKTITFDTNRQTSGCKSRMQISTRQRIKTTEHSIQASSSSSYYYYYYYWGYAVVQLVEALRYKPEGRGFDSRWCHWNFS